MPNLIDFAYLGDYEQNQTVKAFFNTFDENGELTAAFDDGAAGEPTMFLRRVSDQTTSQQGALTRNIDIGSGSVSGLHYVEVTTGAAFHISGDRFQVYTSDGVVNDGTAARSVANRAIREFTIEGTTAGFTLLRAVKVINGTIESATSTRVFRIQGNALNTDTPNFYANQVLTFQPGASNQAIGKVILTSTVITISPAVVEITVQSSFPKIPLTGDPWVLLPEEREVTAYTANIVFEAGIGQGQGDKFTVEWMANGRKIENPSTIITNMALIVWRWSDDAQLVNETNITPSANSELYKHTGTIPLAVAQSEGVVMQATATIDGQAHIFSRTMFNNA